jgi:DNA-binding MarR family transcriptional regulator
LSDALEQPAAPGDVAAALGASLGLLYRRLRQRTAEGEPTLPERSALSRLAQGGPMTATALARQEQISPQSIGATLATLEHRGLVERNPDPNDGRRISLSLTATGLAAVHAKRAARDAQLTQALVSGFTPEERTQLLAIVPLLERLAERL